MSTSAVEKTRFNALISCLGSAARPAELVADRAFSVVDYFGEVASLGHPGLGKSQLGDPWCLLTVDVQGYPADEAFRKLKAALDTQPKIMLRLLARESGQHEQDRGVRSFDPGCKTLTEVDIEASAALPTSVKGLRARLGVSDSQLSGQGVTVVMLDGGVRQAGFTKASRAASFSRSFLGKDYPTASTTRHDLADRFDCKETPYRDAHGSLVSEIVRSIAPDADQMMLKVCNDAGYCPDSSIAKALLYLSNGYQNFPKVDVINLSLGADVTQEDPILRALIERMTGINYGTLLVASLGNNAGAPNHYPADYFELHRGLIPVAAAKETAKDTWQLADFNSRALLERSRASLLAAPGVRLKLTQGNPAGVTGTSFAAPVVSAVAALERQRRPLQNLTATELHLNLLGSAKPMGETKFVQLGN